MIRRGNPAPKIVALVAGGVVLLYVIYVWHDTLSRLRKSEETNEHLNQKHDSLTAQLQVIYEHKSKLEKSLRDDRQSCKRLQTELQEKREEIEKKFSMEKQSFLSKIESLKQDYRMLQSQHQDMETEYNRVSDTYKKTKTDCAAERDKHHQDYLKLRDYAANLKESNEAYFNKNAALLTEIQKLKNEIIITKKELKPSENFSKIRKVPPGSDQFITENPEIRDKNFIPRVLEAKIKDFRNQIANASEEKMVKQNFMKDTEVLGLSPKSLEEKFSLPTNNNEHKILVPSAPIAGFESKVRETKNEEEFEKQKNKEDEMQLKRPENGLERKQKAIEQVKPPLLKRYGDNLKNQIKRPEEKIEERDIMPGKDEVYKDDEEQQRKM